MCCTNWSAFINSIFHYFKSTVTNTVNGIRENSGPVTHQDLLQLGGRIVARKEEQYTNRNYALK